LYKFTRIYEVIIYEFIILPICIHTYMTNKYRFIRNLYNLLKVLKSPKEIYKEIPPLLFLCVYAY